MSDTYYEQQIDAAIRDCEARHGGYGADPFCPYCEDRIEAERQLALEQLTD